MRGGYRFCLWQSQQYGAGDARWRSNKEENSAKAKDLIERLHSAAYAGRIKFRGLKNGDKHSDGHRVIDPLYFSEPRGVRWGSDEIWVRDLSSKHPKFKSQPPFTVGWRDVHLDREDFEAFLRDIGVSVVQSVDAVAPGKQKLLHDWYAGRPTSKHLVLEIARRRFDARNLHLVWPRFRGNSPTHSATRSHRRPR